MVSAPAGFALAGVFAGCGAASVVAVRRGWSPPLRASLLIGALVRLAVVVLAPSVTPTDVRVWFRQAGELVLHGRDPLTALPRFEWNFTPLMPYVFGAEAHVGLRWVYAAKIVPVLADLLVIALVAALTRDPRYRRRNALLYALSPLAVAVAAVHGQVEPVAIALGLGALLLARRGRPAAAGLLLGAAVAAKTWPLLFLPGVLRDRNPRDGRATASVLAGTAVVPLAMVALIPLTLHDSLRAAVRVLAGYRSLVGNWGWTGVLHWAGVSGRGQAGPRVDAVHEIGTAALLVALALTWAALRRLPGDELTLALLLVFLGVTDGFGVQYLDWPVALAYLVTWRGARRFLVAASGYAVLAYLVLVPLVGHPALAAFLEGPVSLPVVVLALAAVPWRLAGLGRDAVSRGAPRRC